MIAITLEKENIGKYTFKKHFKFHNFSEIFYCGMTRLRNTNLSVFLQCQHTRTILRNKNMEQSLFKNIHNYDEIFYWGLTRLGNTNLDAFTHPYSEIFQCVINKLMNANSCIFLLKAILNTILRMENVRRIYDNHKILEILNCDMNKVREQNF